jgi:hypothetical protein
MIGLTRITTDPAVMGGKPCIRGLRVTVGTIVGLVATGQREEEILRLSPTWKQRTFARPCRTPPGAPRKLRSRCRHREVGDRHEPLP